MTWSLDDKPISSVLITRLRYLGDVVMSTVLGEALKAGDPNLRLGYLCEENHGQVLTDEPDWDELHLLRVKRTGGDARSRVEQPKNEATSKDALCPGQSSPSERDRSVPVRGTISRGTFGTVMSLRRARYDLAVDLFFNPRSAWLLRMAGIPLRIGGTRKSRRLLYTHNVLRGDIKADSSFARIAPGGLGEHLCRLAPLKHEESGLDFMDWLVEHFQAGALKPSLNANRRNHSEAAYLVLAPGATWPAKEWPLQKWQDLVAILLNNGGPRVKILAPPGREAEWARPWLELADSRLEVLPAMTLAEVKSLLSGAAGLISVDGGVMHMSVALGVPTLAIFGPTDPDIWFPYQAMGPFRVLALKPKCHPCDRHHCDEFICLPDLQAQQVWQAAKTLFDDGLFEDANVAQ